MKQIFSLGLNFLPTQLYIKGPERHSGGTIPLAIVESATSTDYYEFFTGIELNLGPIRHAKNTIVFPLLLSYFPQ